MAPGAVAVAVMMVMIPGVVVVIVSVVVMVMIPGVVVIVMVVVAIVVVTVMAAVMVVAMVVGSVGWPHDNVANKGTGHVIVGIHCCCISVIVNRNDLHTVIATLDVCTTATATAATATAANTPASRSCGARRSLGCGARYARSTFTAGVGPTRAAGAGGAGRETPVSEGRVTAGAHGSMARHSTVGPRACARGGAATSGITGDIAWCSTPCTTAADAHAVSARSRAVVAHCRSRP